MAKALYGALFDWIVEQVNDSLTGVARGPHKVREASCCISCQGTSTSCNGLLAVLRNHHDGDGGHDITLVTDLSHGDYAQE